MSTNSNKVVWITGASSGIGEALAKSFAAEGAKLVLSARRKEELERVKKSLNIAENNVMILPFDLQNTANAQELAKQVIHTFGRIDILVNNGGISQRSLTAETPMEIDRKIMEINFFGTVAITKAVLPYMLSQSSGYILAMSSVAGKFGFYFRSAYAASKHALHGFFESLRMEVYKKNIQVLIICPGKIRTNISINAITEDGGKHNKMDKSQEEGLSPEACAAEIMTAIKNNKEEIFIGGKEIKAVWLKRLFPKLFSKMIRKQKPE